MEYNCKYYDKKRNYCKHYRDRQCHKLLLECALADKLDEGKKDD